MHKITAGIIWLIVVSSPGFLRGIDFLNLEVGAKAEAMGGSFTGLADDGSAACWNPSGIGSASRPILYLTHGSWFMGLRSEYIGVLWPLESWTLGGSWFYLSSGDIEFRTPDGQLGPSYANTAFTGCLTLSRKIFSWLDAGLNGKYFLEQIERYLGAGFGFDLGMMVNPISSLRIGIVLKNAGPPVRFISEMTALPTALNIGFSYQKKLAAIMLTPSIDIAYEKGFECRFGTELSVSRFFSIRFGDRYDLHQNRFSAGIGVSHHVREIRIEVDYAVTNCPNLGLTHALGLTFGI